MIKVESSTQIDRPRDEVFEFVTSIENLSKWQASVIEARRVSQGTLRVGYQYEQTAKVGPWQIKALCTVTDLKANERFAFQMTSSGPLDCDGRFDLQPVAGGTRLTISGVARLKGFWRVMQPMMASELRKETEKEVATIRLLLEAAAGSPASAVASSRQG